MLDSILTGDIEAFPSYESILITFSDPADESTYFETEVQRDEDTLAQLLKRLQVSEDPSYLAPVSSYAAVADRVLRRGVGTVYCPKDSVTKILQNIERDLTPTEEFPGKSPQTFGDIKVYEYVTLQYPCKINETLYKKGTSLKFTYKVTL